MTGYEETKKVDDALSRGTRNILGSCEPQEGEAYECLNCELFQFERDGCFTEWEKEYGYEKQPNRCPGYRPPKNGPFVLTVSGPI